MKLYEIIDELLFLENNWVDQETGEINEDLEKKLGEIHIEFGVKMESIWKILKNYDAQSKAIETEIEKLRKRKKTIDNNFENLKRYAGQALEPGKKWVSENGLAVYSWRKSTSTNIFAENLVEDEYIDIIRKPRAFDIKAAIKAGKTVSGAELIEKQNLVVK